MILDTESVIVDDGAFDSTGDLDLAPHKESGEDATMGKGNPILINVTGHDLVADGGNDYAVVIESSVDGAVWGPEMRVQAGPNALMGRGVTFGLSSVVSRIIRVSLSGFTAGNYTAAVVLGVYQ